MFSELAQKMHLTSNFAYAARHNRLSKKDNYWFFHTREGVDVGPFLSRSDAQYALLYFAERTTWPNKEQLLEFITGCKLNAGEQLH